MADNSEKSDWHVEETVRTINSEVADLAKIPGGQTFHNARSSTKVREPRWPIC